MNAEDTVVHACLCRVRHACVTGHTGEVFVVLIWSYKRKFPLIRMFLEIFINVPGVITGTFSGISQHPSKALIIVFSFYSAHEVVVEKIEIASICLTSSLPDNILCYNEAMANGDRYSIAAGFERDKEQVPRKFVVGDGEIYGGYMNAPLEPSCKTVYNAYVKAATEVNGVK